MTFEVLCLFLGLGVGIGTGWLARRTREARLRGSAEDERRAFEMNHNAVQIEFAKIAERNRILDDQRQTLQGELAQERQFNISLHAELSRERASRSHLEQKLEHQKTDLSQFQHRLGQEFKSVVQQVFEEKSQTLNDLNKSNLNQLLQPISEKLQDFKQKIEEQHYRETREMIVLHNKLANLESGRWRQGNGSALAGSPQPTAFTPVSAAGSSNPEACLPHEEIEAPTPSKSTPETEDGASVAAPSFASAHVHADDVSHPFSSKQEVEIDNFLKRTLGRAQRRKLEE